MMALSPADAHQTAPTSSSALSNFTFSTIAQPPSLLSRLSDVGPVAIPRSTSTSSSGSPVTSIPITAALSPSYSTLPLSSASGLIVSAVSAVAGPSGATDSVTPPTGLIKTAVTHVATPSNANNSTAHIMDQIPTSLKQDVALSECLNPVVPSPDVRNVSAGLRPAASNASDSLASTSTSPPSISSATIDPARTFVSPETVRTLPVPSPSPPDLYTIFADLAQEKADWNEVRALRERYREEHTELLRRKEEAVQAIQRQTDQATRAVFAAEAALDLVERLRANQERRWVEDKRKADELAAEARRLQEEQVKVEAQRLEEKRKAEEKQKAEERRILTAKRKAAAAQKLAEEKQIAEEKRIAEEKLAAELKHKAEEKLAAEERRRAEELALAERKRDADAAAAKERIAVMEQRAEDDRCAAATLRRLRDTAGSGEITSAMKMDDSNHASEMQARASAAQSRAEALQRQQSARVAQIEADAEADRQRKFVEAKAAVIATREAARIQEALRAKMEQEKNKLQATSMPITPSTSVSATAPLAAAASTSTSSGPGRPLSGGVKLATQLAPTNIVTPKSLFPATLSTSTVDSIISNDKINTLAFNTQKQDHAVVPSSKTASHPVATADKYSDQIPRTRSPVFPEPPFVRSKESSKPAMSVVKDEPITPSVPKVQPPSKPIQSEMTVKVKEEQTLRYPSVSPAPTMIAAGTAPLSGASVPVPPASSNSNPSQIHVRFGNRSVRSISTNHSEVTNNMATSSIQTPAAARSTPLTRTSTTAPVPTASSNQLKPARKSPPRALTTEAPTPANTRVPSSGDGGWQNVSGPSTSVIDHDDPWINTVRVEQSPSDHSRDMRSPSPTEGWEPSRPVYDRYSPPRTVPIRGYDHYSPATRDYSPPDQSRKRPREGDNRWVDDQPPPRRQRMDGLEVPPPHQRRATNPQLRRSPSPGLPRRPLSPQYANYRSFSRTQPSAYPPEIPFSTGSHPYPTYDSDAVANRNMGYPAEEAYQTDRRRAMSGNSGKGAARSNTVRARQQPVDIAEADPATIPESHSSLLSRMSDSRRRGPSGPSRNPTSRKKSNESMTSQPHRSPPVSTQQRSAPNRPRGGAPHASRGGIPNAPRGGGPRTQRSLADRLTSGGNSSALEARLSG